MTFGYLNQLNYDLMIINHDNRENDGRSSYYPKVTYFDFVGGDYNSIK